MGALKPLSRDRGARQGRDSSRYGSGPDRPGYVDAFHVHESGHPGIDAPLSSAALIARAARKDIVLDDEQVRAGSTVYVPVYAVHRHEKLWSEPDRFDPSRFEPEAAKAIDRFCYLPFGAGPRTCIGQNFAQMEAAAVMASLLRSFRLTLWPGHRPEPRLRVTLRPAGGMPMRLQRL